MKALIALSILLLSSSSVLRIPRQGEAEPKLTPFFDLRLDEREVVAKQGEKVSTEGAKTVIVAGVSHKIFSLGEFSMKVMPSVDSTVRYGPAIFALPGKGMVYVVSVTAGKKAASDSLAGIAPSIAQNLGGKIGASETKKIGGVEVQRRLVTLRDGTVKHLDGYLGRQGESHFCVIFEYYASQEAIAAAFIAESLASLSAAAVDEGGGARDR